MYKTLGILFVAFMASAFPHLDQNHNQQQISNHNINNNHGDYHVYPKYEYEYGVHDPHTHDAKKQWETRDGDVVKGSYKLVQPDGKIRVVNYYSDGKSGFNAQVLYQDESKSPRDQYEQMPKSQPNFASHFTKCLNQNYFNGAHYPSSVQQSKQSHSALTKGFSSGLAGGLDPHIVGFDVREPHEYEVVENSTY